MIYYSALVVQLTLLIALVSESAINAAQNNAPQNNPPLVPSASTVEQPAAPAAESSNLPEASRLKISIRQKGGGGPIRKVEVRIGTEKFYTDTDGLVIVTLPSVGADINFYKSGFETSALPWDEIKNVSELEIYLYPSLGAEDEVIIRGNRRPSISKKVISSEEAARVAPGGDPGQVTKLLPGVTTQPGKSEVTIRGSKPSDSAYYLDDIKVPFVYHAVGNLSVLPASMIEDVEFSAGGFGAEYGDASGGVVVLRSKSEIPDKPRTRFTLNLPLSESL